MRRIARFLTQFFVLPALLLTVVNGVGAQSPAPANYAVQPGDMLFISVWKEEDLQKDVLVRPDGGLSFPLAGDMAAAGKSLDQIRVEIESRIQRYIPDPAVTVSLSQTLGNKIYVVGKVNSPGAFLLTGDMDVMQAIGIAGGVTPFAALNDISILRRQGGEQTSLPFRYKDILNGRKLEQNILLRSGDTVVVP